jgi:restriction endonuclease S subunit
MNQRNGLPRAWTESTIGDACSLVTDGTNNSPPVEKVGEYRYLTSKNIRPYRLDLSTAGYVSRAIHLGIHRGCPVEFGDVLFVKDGVNTGNAAVNSLRQPFSMLSSVALLRPKTELLDAAFLVHWLNSEEGYRRMTQNMSGSAIRRLILDEIRSRHFPLPPLSEQRRIAAILDKADRLRRIHRYALELGGSFLATLFLKLFGEPISRKHWSRVELNEVAQVQGGITLSSRRQKLALRKPYLRVANVQTGALDLREVKSIG